MNILFERDLFPEETEIWWNRGASVHEAFLDERKLKDFAPIVARGAIQFHNSVGSALRTKGWPDIRWPFNNPWRIYGYEFLLTLGPEAQLLNHDATLYGHDFFGSAWWNPCNLAEYGKDWPLWVRSEAGTKGFTGGVFTKEEFLTQVEYCRQNNLLDMKLVIAQPKTIFDEHRLLFVGGEYVSGSEYFADGRKPGQDGFIPAEVLKFGKEWSAKFGHNWQGTFVLDIATTDNGLKVVEVNNLLTSGWYAADVEKVACAIIQKVKSI